VVADGGAVTLIAVGDRIVNTGAVTPPNETDVTPERFVPLMVTVFPPERGPEAGTKLVIVGTTGGL
jgi:hypothetical protein